MYSFLETKTGEVLQFKRVTLLKTLSPRRSAWRHSDTAWHVMAWHETAGSPLIAVASKPTPTRGELLNQRRRRSSSTATSQSEAGNSLRLRGDDGGAALDVYAC